jgi:hypothetical protein
VAAAAAVLLAFAAWLVFGRTSPPSTPDVHVAIAEQVPMEILETADVLLDLTDEEFHMALLGDPEPYDAALEAESGG